MAGKRGPKIPPKTRRYVNEAAITYSNTDRAHLASILKEDLSGMGWMTPSQQTLEKMISAARNSDTSEDDPWCLGKSTKWSIPNEANEDLLKLFRWCILVGNLLTIRQAKWIAKLRGTVEFDSLLTVANDYAMSERLWEMDNPITGDVAFDTTPLDMDVMLCNTDYEWTYSAGIHLQLFPVKTSHMIKRFGLVPDTAKRFTITGLPGDTVQKRVFAENLLEPQRIYVIDELPVVSQDTSDQPGIDNEGPYYLLSTKTLDPDFDGLYAIWLRHIIDAPGWSALHLGDKVEVANQLHSEVKAAKTYLEETLGLWFSKENEAPQVQEDFHEWFLKKGFPRRFARAMESGGDSKTIVQELVSFALRTDWEPSTEILSKVGLQSSMKHGGK